ncbi:hypothetical protein SK803_24215 [Lentzea sp. BCCO 10_0856]|uniref:Uncharacterized protein n=1 Tax=Lentzea miocenica TaxID=3095431 RepID=A0ABU4T5A1_9PSEU|nr:hypothetical protein [Lentzea sp. BCCO 10_0856]MDX8033335.1 hypothetical protein [Lentzea sp. BCCO 10_0856]
MQRLPFLLFGVCKYYQLMIEPPLTAPNSAAMPDDETAGAGVGSKVFDPDGICLKLLHL